MGVLSFDYQIVAGESNLLPLCEIRLLGPTGAVPILAMIDSGATHPIFPMKAAEDAGIVLPRNANFWIQYGGSRTDARKVDAALMLRDFRWRAEVAFVERLDFRYALLGRIGVFAQFNEVVFLEKLKNPRVELRY